MSHVSAVNGKTGNVTGADVLANVPGGTNKRTGTLVLTGATPVVVANTLITATSHVFLGVRTVGGTPAFSWVSARSAGVSFSVTGTASDTSTLNYLIVEPS